MWGPSSVTKLAFLLLLATLIQSCLGSRKLTSLVKPPPNLLKYHNGAVLEGDIPMSILWYGKFSSTQKSIVTDFLLSLTPKPTSRPSQSPTVSQWWRTIDDEYVKKAMKGGSSNKKNPTHTRIILADQISDDKCTMGKALKKSQLAELAGGGALSKQGGVTLVLTAEDVTVEGFCMSSCGLHSSDEQARSAYIWVGNSATQCPGQCAWPFHQPIYGPQTPPLVSPNSDVGVDGMVINLASLLAGTVTNPFGNGYFQGPSDGPLEAASACPGVYGRGAYPGYAGELLVDDTTGGSYNAQGTDGRKYLLPAIYDPSSSSCSTLV